MTAHTLRARPPRGSLDLPLREEVPETKLVDAAYFPGGRADAFYRPRSEGEIAAVLRTHGSVLVVGAQSSLTGGATPAGGALVSAERLDSFEIDAHARTARSGAGVVLSVLQAACRERGLFVAPAPTYDGATLGGMAATNAAGAATFKHGTMRRAVRAVTVVLADGSVLDVRRGETFAHADGWIDVVLVSGETRRVPVPRYRWPAVPKCSAGYFAADGMDLVDLFVGSEGTLGVLTEVVVDLTPVPAASLACWLAVPDEREGLAVAARLREASIAAWRGGDPAGLDVPSIEHADARSLQLLREDGEDRKQGIAIDPSARMALFFEVTLPRTLAAGVVLDELSDPGGPPTAVRSLARTLGDSIAGLDVAFPGETTKAAKYTSLREAVPMCVNHRVRDARLRDPCVQKVAGDFIVPFERLGDALDLYRAAFSVRGLDHAIWGHVSDGNVHPNVIPRDARDVAAGKEALLELALDVIRLGGSPLAEHGVGRNPVKQEMLRMLVGESGVEEMRAVRRALDPEGKLAPGVLFAP